MPGTIRWRALRGQILHLLETLEREMEDYADQRSENWQETDRADTLRDAIDLVQEAGTILSGIL